MDYDELFANVCEALQREQRISYRALRRRFELSDDDLEDLKDELIYAKKLAIDEENRVLVWTGGKASAPSGHLMYIQTQPYPPPTEPRTRTPVLHPQTPCRENSDLPECPGRRTETGDRAVL